MRRIFRAFLLMGITFNFNQGCSSQDKSPSLDRQPAVAGRFYPGDPESLRSMLNDFFIHAKPRTQKEVAAIITPHAGYVFSGQVAASGFNQVDPDKKFENVFVLASSHQASFMGASIYNRGDYLTPLGKVPVNHAIADKLIHDYSFFTFNPEAELYEHSLEVQVPFLQYHLKHDFKLVPIVLGTQSEQTCQKLAQALKPYFNEKNLFVASSDFSHYPSYDDAKAADQSTCDAIVMNDPSTLMKMLGDYKKKHIPNLATNLCGWTSVLTLLYITSGDPSLKIAPVQYMNSGDAKYGDKNQVVGYWSLAVTRNKSVKQESGFNFSHAEKETLLTIARNTMVTYVKERMIPKVEDTGFSANLVMKAGAFVTLRKNGELRGCIGRFSSDIPLYQLVQQMSVASATEDNRFLPVTPDETGHIDVEISVLSPMKRVYSPDDIILGRHGIYIKKGMYSGTFLPQVATETGWSKEEFLGHCSRDKAGIGWDGWKDAELYTYEAFVFSEKEVTGRK